MPTRGRLRNNYEDKFHRGVPGQEEEVKVEPKSKKRIPMKTEVPEVESESSEELLEEVEESTKKGRATSSTSNAEDSARSWMELGEKRKGRTVLRPMRRR